MAKDKTAERDRLMNELDETQQHLAQKEEEIAALLRELEQMQ